MTGENGKYNYSKVVHVYSPFSYITCSAKNYKIALALTIEVLGTIAEQERISIKKRQAEGIAVSKAKGVAFGRPKAQKPPNWEEVIGQWKVGEITATKAMELTGTKRTTFYKLLKT